MSTSEFTGMQYLQMDIASMFGLDKKTWKERLDWFKQHEPELENLSGKADDSNGYIAAVNAYRNAKAGKAIGYPINLDATASGCQVLALLTGDSKAAARVNLINTGKREDLYSYILNKMTQVAGVSENLSREKVKKAIMTSLYGSEKKPKEVFGEENYALFEKVMNEELPAVWKLNKFLLNHWNPEAVEYNWIMPDNFHVNCQVLKSTYFSVKCMGQDVSVHKYVMRKTDKGRFLSANLAHSVDALINREITMRCNFSEEYKNYLKKLVNLKAILENSDEKTYKSPKGYQMFKTLWQRYLDTGFLSVRILQYVTKEALRKTGIECINKINELVNTLPDKTFEVFSIHDCFRCLPNYGNELRQQYRVVCAQIANSNMLSDILSSIFRTKLNVQKLDPKLGEKVLQSEYAIC